MNSELVKSSWALAKARQLASYLSLRHPCDMEIDDIAFSRNIIVKDGKLNGAEGRLVRISNTGVITVSDSIKEQTRRRFIISHEIGHFELHQNHDQLALCTNRDLIYNYQQVQPEEREATIFGIELLLPEELLKDKYQNKKPSFQLAKTISKEFQTSLTFSLMRILDFTSYPVALVVCEKGQIKWFKTTENFGYGLTPKDPLDSRTVAYEYFKRNVLSEESDKVPADAWIKNRRVNPEDTIEEECLPIPSYSHVLALLHYEKTHDA